MDKTFDNSRVFRIFEDVICKEVFGKRCKVEPTRGVENILYDMIVKNSKFGKDLTVEVKTRQKFYNDIAAEITQYESESKRFKRIIRKLNTDDIDEDTAWEEIKKNNTSWVFKSKADLILYIKPNEVLLFSKKSLIEYIYNNLKDLSFVYSALTTGAYNLLIPEDKLRHKKHRIDTELYYSAYLN